MSKKINVNPDHYKSAGRERQGDNIVHEDEKRQMTLQERVRARQREAAKSARTARTAKKKAGAAPPEDPSAKS